MAILDSLHALRRLPKTMRPEVSPWARLPSLHALLLPPLSCTGPQPHCVVAALHGLFYKYIIKNIIVSLMDIFICVITLHLKSIVN